ncbi:MAG: hypothetical protein AAFZ09_13345, partial [Pseudomonadota bacterium]
EIERYLPENPISLSDFEQDLITRQSARVIGQIAFERLQSGEVSGRPAPLYVRPADAAPPKDPTPVILP